MTTTTNDAATTAVFDCASHAERGDHLRAELASAVELLAAAEAEQEAAQTAVDLLDVLSDTDAKITKTRLAVERAEARVNRAAAAERAARRKVDAHNTDTSLVEGMRPMLTALSGDHPAVAIHVLPAEPDWAAVTAPALVAIQPHPAVADELSHGQLRTAAADREHAVRLTYVHDQLHRDLLADREAILIAASRSGVALRSTDRPGAPEGIAANGIHPRTRQLGNGVKTTEISLHVAIYPEVPVISDGDLDPSPFVRAVIARLRRRLGGWVKATDPQASVTLRGGVRRTSIRLEVRVEASAHDAAADLGGWKDHAYPALGRLADVRVSELSGSKVSVELTAVSALPE